MEQLLPVNMHVCANTLRRAMPAGTCLKATAVSWLRWRA